MLTRLVADARGDAALDQLVVLVAPLGLGVGEQRQTQAGLRLFPVPQPGARATAVSVVQTDQELPERVLTELLENPSLVAARRIHF